MNGILHFYKRFGVSSRKVLDKISWQPILKGVKVPLKQTPGRAQYYYPETLHLHPQNIIWKVRLPQKLAASEESKKYDDIVEKEVMKYLQSKLPQNLFGPDEGINLDLSVEQIRQMLRASEKSFARAESGEVQKMIDSEKEIGNAVDDFRDKIDSEIDEVEEKVN